MNQNDKLIEFIMLDREAKRLAFQAAALMLENGYIFIEPSTQLPLTFVPDEGRHGPYLEPVPTSAPDALAPATFYGKYAR